MEEVQSRDMDDQAWKITRGNNFAPSPKKISDIDRIEEKRILTPDKEFNRALGGGIVLGSVVLLGGEPGIGKSTLMLQLALQLKNLKVLYVTGEESEKQIRMRADRIPDKNENARLPDGQVFVLAETSLENIFQQIVSVEPQMLIVDSIQTLYSGRMESSAGSISQVRNCAAQLLRYAKESGTPVFLIGHITKEGTLAGPKVLEHMVDTVLQFEGDRHHMYRMVRTMKNRFGSSSEIGIYEMRENGLREVANPSEILISSSAEEKLSGVAVSAMMEGVRPMLIETQALVSSAVYGTPQRSSTGFDLRRLNMLLAVLEKRCGFKLGVKDVFLNITGGIRVDDPAIDLGVVCSVLSSMQDTAIPERSVFAAEVGLSGEIRPVGRIEQRISEAEKLGFENIYISKYNLPAGRHGAKGLKNNSIKIHSLAKVEEAFERLFR